MPKVNVYLPDDLAESVKDTGLPVSAICQRALEQSVKRVTAIRAVAVGDLEGLDPTAGLTHFTQRAKEVVKLAIARAQEREAAEIGTRDLLHALLAEGTNLALHVLRSIEVEPATVLREVERAGAGERGRAVRLSSTAANALELTVVEALLLGHNYIGCEHLLLGLIAEPDGTAGEVLRGLGVESRSARQAVSAALAGYVHLRANQGGADPVATALGKALEPVLRRLDRLEERAGLNQPGAEG
ncbi:Clp protease N-terminal domain-containing protein [Actinophytocola gossypii]|uniref:ATP-dependent Clp protease ATP-binding subunit n=1 Tax=Actinophytocola gossypii TaxID=2812003 RepID=A0ABT2J7J3_9PSEU|nr:Clp protease N-terminal domain-containing protein [Actinophytocola gossypii]MCT2583814.1 ATP-dependent Clp protease ATP-binding subunit [Actinophytocola gossypii]